VRSGAMSGWTSVLCKCHYVEVWGMFMLCKGEGEVSTSIEVAILYVLCTLVGHRRESEVEADRCISRLSSQNRYCPALTY
jgi:hypothetical protein